MSRGSARAQPPRRCRTSSATSRSGRLWRRSVSRSPLPPQSCTRWQWATSQARCAPTAAPSPCSASSLRARRSASSTPARRSSRPLPIPAWRRCCCTCPGRPTTTTCAHPIPPSSASSWRTSSRGASSSQRYRSSPRWRSCWRYHGSWPSRASSGRLSRTASIGATGAPLTSSSGRLPVNSGTPRLTLFARCWRSRRGRRPQRVSNCQCFSLAWRASGWRVRPQAGGSTSRARSW
mmetsp:Transcript_36389/g.94487  ORF Transcript_36389/g.94487 Transcript_36389/m.94487 type:complete len:235 (-) Transcript_36389:179-883(-)